MVSLMTAFSVFFFPVFMFQFSSGHVVDEKSQLEMAFKQGDVDRTKFIIKNGGLENFPGPKNLEKIYNKLRIVKILLSNGIVEIVNQENDLQNPPYKENEFDVALIPGTPLILRLVVNVTAIQNWGNKTIEDGRKPIHIIASLPDVSPVIVQIILETGNDDVNTKTESKVTPLMLAASSGNLEVVKFLVERGARINNIASVPVNGEESGGHFAIAELFSKRHIIPANSKFCYSALIVAIVGNHVDILNYLISMGADVNSNEESWLALFHAVFNGRTEILEILLRSGIDINAQDMMGSTALHKAAEAGNVEMAKILVKNGASLNATDSLGWAPLHVASFFSKIAGKEMIEFLVQSGSSMESLTEGGYSSLNLVEAGINPRFLSFLVKNFGCLNRTEIFTDVPQEDPNENHTDIVNFVLQLGAPLNQQDDILGWTALHWAAAAGDLEVTKLLVKYGAVISVRSKTDRNPLETAVYFGRTRLVEFLRTAKDLVN